MRYYYLAPEGKSNTTFTNGIEADGKGLIPLILLKDDFLMDKFIFDMYAYEVLELDVYCLFQVLETGIENQLTDSSINHMFAGSFKLLEQDRIDKKHILPYQSAANYEGMGLEPGIIPVENKEKFTPEFKRKILEYLTALG